MHILILGAGALGTLFGARLYQNNFRVSLLSKNREHIQKIQNQGLILEEMDGREKLFSLPAYAHPNELPSSPDLVLVLVKSYHTSQAVYGIKDYSHAGTIFLSLQNGIGNLENIEKHTPPENILLGTTAQGATFLEPGKIRHGGAGPTIIGSPRENSLQNSEDIVDIFSQSGLDSKSTSNILDVVWQKLLVNVGINAITALLEINNGWITEDEEAKELCTQAVEEAAQVATAQGISIPESPAREVLNIASATYQNISSMLQDIQKGKPTEIDAMNGAIAETGEKLNIKTPVNNTLSQLVKSKQNLRSR